MGAARLVGGRNPTLTEHGQFEFHLRETRPLIWSGHFHGWVVRQSGRAANHQLFRRWAILNSFGLAKIACWPNHRAYPSVT